MHFFEKKPRLSNEKVHFLNRTRHLNLGRTPLDGIAEPLSNIAELLGDVRTPLDGIAEPLSNIAELLGDVRTPLGDIAEPLDDTQTHFADIAAHYK